MKKTITKLEQKRVNELLKARRERELKKVLSISMERERLTMKDEEDYIRKDGMTHLEYQQLSNLDR